MVAKRRPRGEQQILKQIGLKIHRELFRQEKTTESLSTEIGLARSTIREVIAGRSNVRVLNLRAIVLGLGFANLREFLADIDGEKST
ncbi:MAG TPA: hypothetical protein VM598_09710 [Bdellovibrionota bacterium]|nr:hypothetical protein [Bdellovibrionota bacterium]